MPKTLFETYCYVYSLFPRCFFIVDLELMIRQFHRPEFIEIKWSFFKNINFLPMRRKCFELSEEAYTSELQLQKQRNYAEPYR